MIKQKFTFHFVGFILHFGQSLLVTNQFLDTHSEFVLEFLYLGLGLVDLIDFGNVVVLLSEFNGSFFGVCFDVLFRLVFAVVDLLYFLLEFVNEPERMSFRVLFTGANRICNIIFIMGDIPNTISSSEFVSLISL